MGYRTCTRTVAAITAIATIAAACGDDGVEPVAQDSAAPVDATEATTANVETTGPTRTQAPTAAPATTAPPTTAAPSRTVPPPLVGATELLVDGVAPLGDVGVPGFLPPDPPGRYHSYRLGTEVVIEVDQPFTVGQHMPASVAWDTEQSDVPVFLYRWSADELLEPDEWVEALNSSDWDVVQRDSPDIGSHSVRRFDVTATPGAELIGEVHGMGALAFQPDVEHRVWIVDQDDGLPIVVSSGVPDEAAGEGIDQLVSTMQIGPTGNDPRTGRMPLEYGGFAPWIAEAGLRYRTLLYDDAVLTFPVDVTGAFSDFPVVDVPGDFTGTTAPRLAFGSAGQLIVPPDDPAAGLFSSTLTDPPADAAALKEFVAALDSRGLVTGLRNIDTAATLLGSTTSAIEFEVPNGDEVPLFVAAPDGWNHLGIETLQPGRTHRMWTADVGTHVAVVLASADVGNVDDLEQVSDLAESVMAGFEPG